jgi:hypothetical protein
MQGRLSCEQANQIDLVDWIQKLGFAPQKISNQGYWFVSPFRDEKTPSFKINRQKNVWYDHGIGKGGTLVDFGLLYFNCTVAELLQKLSINQTQSFSFQQPRLAAEKKDNSDSKIVVVEDRNLAFKPLLQYLQKRSIPMSVVERFCREIDFLLHGKKYTAIGFQNSAGGYELRNEYFKGSSSPKSIRFIDLNNEQVGVFEGFFSFLSFLTMLQNRSPFLTSLQPDNMNFLVLNSLAFFEKSRDKMENHEQVHLFLDRDQAGMQATQKALQWSSKYIDQSLCYSQHKDLNELLVNREPPRQKQSQRPGRHN